MCLSKEDKVPRPPSLDIRLNIACNYFSDLGIEQGHQLMKGQYTERNERNLWCPIFSSAIGQAGCFDLHMLVTAVMLSYLNLPSYNQSQHYWQPTHQTACSQFAFYLILSGNNPCCSKFHGKIGNGQIDSLLKYRTWQFVD